MKAPPKELEALQVGRMDISYDRDGPLGRKTCKRIGWYSGDTKISGMPDRVLSER